MGSARSSIRLYANAAESQPSSRGGTGQTLASLIRNPEAVTGAPRLRLQLHSDGIIVCFCEIQAPAATFFFFFSCHCSFSSSSFSALVWGSSVKHNPQKVGKDHVMEDEDVIQLVKK